MKIKSDTALRFKLFSLTPEPTAASTDCEGPRLKQKAKRPRRDDYLLS